MPGLAAETSFPLNPRKRSTFSGEWPGSNDRSGLTAVGRRVAVIGGGCLGQDLARTFSDLGVLRAVCDTEPMTMAAIPDATVTHYCHLADCLADPKITCVAIAAPAASHYELVRSALTSGKDVFVEKPLALNARDGRSLVVLAAASNRILMVGNQLRYHPAICKLKEMVDEGEIGKVEYICSTGQTIDRARPEESILWSLAPHEVSVLLSLLGEMPSAASCQGGDYVGSGVSDVTVSQFEFAGGVRAQVLMSRLYPLSGRRLVVVGSVKMAVYDETAANRLVVHPRHDGGNQALSPAGTVEESVPIEDSDPTKAECQAFLDSVNSRRPPVNDGRHELRDLEVFDACVRSLSHDGARTALRAPARSRIHDARPARTEDKHLQPADAGSIGAAA